MPTLNEQVSAGADDARSNSTGGSYNNNQTTYYIGKKGGVDYWIGHRFQAVAVPQGATIESAILDLYNATIGQGSEVSMLVVGNDVDDAAAYGVSNKPSDNVDTSASELFTFDVSAFQAAQGFGNVTWDIASIIQEIVDRTGWVSGNDLAIVTRDGGSAADNNISISTYDRASDRGAKLTITYSEGGGPPVQTSAMLAMF